MGTYQILIRSWNERKDEGCEESQSVCGKIIGSQKGKYVDLIKTGRSKVSNILEKVLKERNVNKRRKFVRIQTGFIKLCSQMLSKM